jgi:hypothetical protein
MIDMSSDKFSKPYQYTPPVRPDRKRTSLTSITNMLQGALKRHGVAAQVTAAIIVDRANEVLDDLLGPSPIRSDVQAISVQNGTIVIGCKNAAASYDIDGMQKEIMARINAAVPEADIHAIIARVQIEKGRF